MLVGLLHRVIFIRKQGDGASIIWNISNNHDTKKGSSHQLFKFYPKMTNLTFANISMARESQVAKSGFKRIGITIL